MRECSVCCTLGLRYKQSDEEFKPAAKKRERTVSIKPGFHTSCIHSDLNSELEILKAHFVLQLQQIIINPRITSSVPEFTTARLLFIALLVAVTTTKRSFRSWCSFFFRLIINLISLIIFWWSWCSSIMNSLMNFIHRMDSSYLSLIIFRDKLYLRLKGPCQTRIKRYKKQIS